MTCPYESFTPGTVAFCEERLCAWVQEPSNTYSSIGYLLVGAYMLWTMPRPFDARLVCIALAEIMIGIGSIAFHGTGTFYGELIDQTGMYMLSCLIMVFAAANSFGWSPQKSALAYVGSVLLSGIINVVIPPIGIPLFALQLNIGLIWEGVLRSRATDKKPFNVLFRGVGLFLVSFGIWALDFSHLVCDPQNHLITGHAIWHILNAICIFELYRFYRNRFTQISGLANEPR